MTQRMLAGVRVLRRLLTLEACEEVGKISPACRPAQRLAERVFAEGRVGFLAD